MTDLPAVVPATLPTLPDVAPTSAANADPRTLE